MPHSSSLPHRPLRLVAGAGLAVAIAALVAIVLLILGKVAAMTPWPASDRPQMPATAKLGHAFLSEYLLPFEVGSIVLLGAMIGAVVLARRAVKRDWEKQ